MSADEAWVEGLVGSTLARRYRLNRLLGAGGMGAVFEAMNTALDRRVAIKVLLPRIATNHTAVARFQREAKAAAKVAGHGIAGIIDFDVDESVGPFMVLELLIGEGLFERLERGTLTPTETVRIASALLLTLARVHEHGIIHRDLKPENVFISSEPGGEVVKILDFGIARIVSAHSMIDLTGPGSVLGTPAYMPPEQLRGSPPIDHRADLYAVGGIMYHCLTGRPPHDAATLADLIRSVLGGEVTPLSTLRPDISSGLQQTVDRALAFEPGKRFEDADSMRHSLEQALGRRTKSLQSTVPEQNAQIALMHAPTAPAPVAGVPAPVTPATAPAPSVPAPFIPATRQAPPVTPAPAQAPPGRLSLLGLGSAAIAVAALAGVIVFVVMTSGGDDPHAPAVDGAPAWPTAAPATVDSTATEATPEPTRAFPLPWEVAALSDDQFAAATAGGGSNSGDQQALEEARRLEAQGRRGNAVALLRDVSMRSERESDLSEPTIRCRWLLGDLLARRIDSSGSYSLAESERDLPEGLADASRHYGSSGALPRPLLGCAAMKRAALYMHLRHELARVATRTNASGGEHYQDLYLQLASNTLDGAVELGGVCVDEARELQRRLSTLR